MKAETKDFKEILKEIKETPVSIINIDESKCEPITVKVEQSRYEKLIACEKELELLKIAVGACGSYSMDLERVREIFGIEKKGNE